MARYLRLDDFKLGQPEPTPELKLKDTYYCYKCQKYHKIYSQLGNDHKDYKNEIFK